jgi:probable HAF family extracellular repeat protein
VASAACIVLAGSALVLIGGPIHARAGGPVGGHAFLYTGGVMTDLGTLPGGTDSIAQGINSQGQVVGTADPGAGGIGGAFLWTAQSGMVELNTVLPANSGWILTDATGINDSGQITGIGSHNGGFPQRGFILTLPPAGGSASIIDIGVMPGGSSALPSAINSSGQVVGQADMPNPNVFGGTSNRAFLYSAGTLTSLGALTVAGDSTGADINDGGEVAGTSETNQIDSHAFLYTQGAMMNLGTGIGEGINNAGQVVGQGLFNGSRHAFVYGAGAMTDLGTLPGGTFSVASGINVAGKIVGFSDTSNGAFHAAVFGGSTVIDIGTLPGFDDSLATKVNAAGQIIGISWPGALNTDTDLGLTGVPANITVNATHPSGAVLTYSAPTAIDEAGDIPAPSVSCIPSSGSTFAIGTTTVTCTASSADDTPSTVSGTFTVTVTFKPTPASVKVDVNQFLASGMIKNAGLANSLLAKLDAASAAQASGDCAGAAAIYQALINELQAQSGKGVAAVAASPLILEVQFLIANCP